MLEGALSQMFQHPKYVSVKQCENTVSEDVSQDIQKQNTLNKIIVKNHPVHNEIFPKRYHVKTELMKKNKIISFKVHILDIRRVLDHN